MESVRFFLVSRMDRHLEAPPGGTIDGSNDNDTQDIRETILKCLAGMLDDEGTSTHIVIYSKQFNRVSQNNVAMSGSTM